MNKAAKVAAVASCLEIDAEALTGLKKTAVMKIAEDLSACAVRLAEAAVDEQ